jgi:murein DD-endopeptidase MepM/ murein hydrolase activator NlpD
MRNSVSILAVGFVLILTTPHEVHASPGWQAPLANPVLVHQFLQPSSDYSAGHRGVDYLAKIGQAVLAPSDGAVKFVGRVVNRGVLTLQHAGSLITSFEPICSTLRPGDAVLRGSVIGRVCQRPGYQNHCGVRVCLHFALRTSTGYLSPLVTIGGLSPSRLLPTRP